MDVISNLFSYNRFFKRIEPLPLNPFRFFLPSTSTSEAPVVHETVPVAVKTNPVPQYVLPS